MLHRTKGLIRRPQFTFAGCVAAVAVLHAVSALSMPVPARRLDNVAIAVSLAILLVHAAVYWFGDSLRARAGVPAYAAVQAGLLLGFALVAHPGALMLGLVMLLTVETLMVAGQRWGVVPITAGAMAFFVIAQLVTGGIYQAAGAALVLALTGAIGHAAIIFARQRGAAAVPVVASSPLSSRETQVLRELVAGARNAEIAARLGISERTVKAHLASIYLPLGVETRAAAVAAAMQRQLV
jgi:DNA-binding CsgD family transcriptional regulator